MFRRPIFLTGILIAVLIACLEWISAYTGVPDSALPKWADCVQGQELVVSGRIRECEIRTGGQRLYLDHIRILETAEPSEHKNTVSDSFREGSFDGAETEKSSIYQIIIPTNDKIRDPGDWILVRGTCRTFSRASNPGQFDAKSYYRKKQVLFSLSGVSVLEERKSRETWKKKLYRWKYQIYRSACRNLGEEQAALFAAIALGEKGLMEEYQKELFQEGGISHIFAISGLHIALLGMSLYGLMRKAGIPLWVRIPLSAFILGSYITMVGWSISSVRAYLMFLLWLGAAGAGRGYDALTALGAAAVCILLENPGALVQSSFLLSFLAILCIGILLPAMKYILKQTSLQGKQILPSFALFWGMFPCVLYFYYQISVWSILVNALVLPLMTALVGFGLIGGIAGILWEKAGIFLAAPCHYLLWGISWLCSTQRRLPYAVLVLGKPDGFQIFMYYGILAAGCIGLFFLRRKAEDKSKQRKFRAGWIPVLFVCILILTVSTQILHSPEKMKITCLDVGQGDGILIQIPGGQNCFIDGGSTSEQHIWDYRIESVLKSNGIREISWWFVTHMDEDHISGLTEYLDLYERNMIGQNVHGITLRHLVFPFFSEEDERMESVLSRAAELGIEVHFMQRTDRIRTGGRKDGTISCLSPDAEEPMGNKNDDGLVLMLEYGTFRMLFAADISAEAERKLLENGADLQADVLKIAHHGSAYSTTEPFLEKVMPKAAVISCSERNRYGHPSPDTLRRLEKICCRICCTKDLGAVQIVSDGNRFQISGYYENKHLF